MTRMARHIPDMKNTTSSDAGVRNNQIRLGQVESTEFSRECSCSEILKFGMISGFASDQEVGYSPDPSDSHDRMRLVLVVGPNDQSFLIFRPL